MFKKIFYFNKRVIKMKIIEILVCLSEKGKM